MKQIRIWIRLSLLLPLVVFMLLALATPTWAAEFRFGDTVVISAEEVIDDDLFLTGGRIEMNGTVRGDLLATGAEVIVNGVVEGSLLIAAQTLEVNGQVDGSVYAGGYSLRLGNEALVERNLYFGGFSLTSERGSALGRSLYMGGYQLVHNGEVSQDLNFSGGALELNGVVGRNLNAQVSASEDSTMPDFTPPFPGAVPMASPGFRMGDQADVGGRLEVVETAPEPEVRPSPAMRFATWLGRLVAARLGEFIALVIVGALMLRFWPEVVERSRTAAQENALPSAGWGCLVTLIFIGAVPLVALAVLLLALLGGLVTFGQLFQHILSLGGAGLALAVVVFVFVLALVTKAIMAFLGGRLILNRLSPATLEGNWGSYWSLAIGALIYEILRVIPLFGWLLSLAVTLVGLGAIYYVVRDRLQPSLPATDAPA